MKIITKIDTLKREALEKAIKAHTPDISLEIVSEAGDDELHLFLTENEEIKNTRQLVLPVRLGAVIDKIKALSGARSYAKKTYIFGPYSLLTAENILKSEAGKVVRLTDKETHILAFLYEKTGALVNREMLLEEVWGYHKDIETHTIETHIYRLRQKIEPDPSNPIFLITEEQGYRLII